MTNHLKSNVARFPSETIEGETILIDSEKGVLLLLVGSAPWIWARFDQGADRDTVIAELAAAWGERPAVLLTGDTAPDRLAEARTAGFALLHKPVDPPALRRTLLELLERRG